MVLVKMPLGPVLKGADFSEFQGYVEMLQSVVINCSWYLRNLSI